MEDQHFFKLLISVFHFTLAIKIFYPFKPKSSFCHPGISYELCLVPADKAVNNIVNVRGLYFIDTLKRELIDINAYKLQVSLNERAIVSGMVVIQPYILVSKLKKTMTRFLLCTGYINSINGPIMQDLLLILVLVGPQNFLISYCC